MQIDVPVPSDENLYARVNPARNGSIYEWNAQDGTVLRRFKLEDGRSGSGVVPVSMTESSYPSNTARESWCRLSARPNLPLQRLLQINRSQARIQEHHKIGIAFQALT